VVPMTGSWTQHAWFDNRNRMMAAWADGSGAPADAYAFAYDANGERVLRYRVQDDGVHDATFYLRDEGGNVLTEYMWVPEQPGDTLGQWYRLWDWAYRGREPMARIARGGLYREYTSLVADHLGSTRAEYGPDGLVNFDYAPFGEVANQPTGTTLETHLFTGHEREFLGTSPPGDALQGRDYMHARYYGFNLRRFVSMDPVRGEVGSSQSWNRYSYVMNSPITGIDPDGRADLRTDEEKRVLESPDVQAAVGKIMDNGAKDGNEWGAEVVNQADGSVSTEEVCTSGMEGQINFTFTKDPETGGLQSEGGQELNSTIHGHPQASGLKDPFKKTSGPNLIVGEFGSTADGNLARVTGKPAYVVVEDKMLLRVTPRGKNGFKSKKILTKKDFQAYVQRIRKTQANASN